MSKWEDTVMSEEMARQQVELLVGQIADGTFFGVEKGTTIEKPVADFLDDWAGQQKRNLETQARISFEAGREQAFKEMLGLPKDMDVYKSENIVEEKSYKMGYKQARKEMNLQSTSLADLCLENRKAGIQEVVRWIQETEAETAISCSDVLWADWLAKLKEWGI